MRVPYYPNTLAPLERATIARWFTRMLAQQRWRSTICLSRIREELDLSLQ